MPYFVLTDTGTDRFTDFWDSSRTRRTWTYTKEDRIEEGLLRDLFHSTEPVYYSLTGEKGKVLRKLEDRGWVERRDR